MQDTGVYSSYNAQYIQQVTNEHTGKKRLTKTSQFIDYAKLMNYLGCRNRCVSAAHPLGFKVLLSRNGQVGE